MTIAIIAGQCSFCPEPATGHSPSGHVSACDRHARAGQRLAIEVIDAQPLLAEALNNARFSLALQVVRHEQTPHEAPWKRALDAAHDIGAEAGIALGEGRTSHTVHGAIDDGYQLVNAARQLPLAPDVRARVLPLVDALRSALAEASAQQGSVR